MKDTKENRQNWFDNNPFFNTEKDFEKFEASMLAAEANGNLPIAFQYEQPEELTVNDIKLFSERFKEDTGLPIKFQLETCVDCGNLHCIIFVGLSLDDDEKVRC